MRARPATSLRRAFVDTSAYYALTDASDANHTIASAIITDLAGERTRLFTTNFVLAETHALLVSKLGPSIALKVLRELDHSSTTVIRATAADEYTAREILESYQDKDFSLADAISFAVMERLGIRSAFSFDRHFAQYGLTVLTPNAP